MYVYVGLHFYVFISVFVSVNRATIISNNSMYYVNEDRNLIKKIDIYRTLEKFSDKQMEIQVTSVSNLPCKFEIVTHNCNSVVDLHAT